MRYAYVDSETQTITSSSEIPDNITMYWEFDDDVDVNALAIDPLGEMVQIASARKYPWEEYDFTEQKWYDPRPPVADAAFVADNYNTNGKVTTSGNTISFENMICLRSNGSDIEYIEVLNTNFTYTNKYLYIFVDWSTKTLVSFINKNDIPASGVGFVGEYRGGDDFVSNINGKSVVKTTDIMSSTIETNHITDNAVSVYRYTTPQFDELFVGGYMEIKFNSTAGSKGLALIKYNTPATTKAVTYKPGFKKPRYFHYHDIDPIESYTITENSTTITYNYKSPGYSMVLNKSTGVKVFKYNNNGVTNKVQPNGNYSTVYNSSAGPSYEVQTGTTSNTVVAADGVRTESYTGLSAGIVKIIQPDLSYKAYNASGDLIREMGPDFITKIYNNPERINNNTATRYNSYQEWKPNGALASGTLVVNDDGTTVKNITPGATTAANILALSLPAGNDQTNYVANMDMVQFDCVDGENFFGVGYTAASNNSMHSMVVLENKK